ncbi:hypothetical protein [Sphingobacterium faecale]|uniref:Uncharacterized protein n=1 Tax=Sphingobacterium faecale TaxID=2803775 RepID=A0ABS1R2T8_9SPHI|nr:hypothetical protein [Sphingobacterium faecale]MBL1408998.1 hypothetical protein [Sphingobacterium faecale]
MKAISYIKKNSMLLLAGAAILSFSSFKAVEKYLQTSYYWFEYDATGTTLLNQTAEPALSPENPFGCDTGDQKCAKAYTSYNMVSSSDYRPGTEALELGQPIIVHKDSN